MRLIGSLLLLLANLAFPQQPQTPKKIQTLIITGQNGHDWLRVTPLLRQSLEESGLFEVRITEDFRGAGPETLASYDLVIVNYYDSRKPELRWGARSEQALVNFVESGKGLVIYHFSLAAFDGWKEWEEMSGGNWRPNNGHHSPPHNFTVTVRVPDHPIMQGIRPKFRQNVDELYANLKWQSDKSRYQVLATAYDDHKLYMGKARQPIPGDGLDHPMLWVSERGKGRIFVTALGHDMGAVQTPEFTTTFLRGSEWAATAKVTLPVPPRLQTRAPHEDTEGRVVTPSALASGLPSDAIALFNGKDLSGWRSSKGEGPAGWKVENGEILTVTRAGSILTEQKFGSSQFHLEYNIPDMPNQKGQLKGNSGIYLPSHTEIQILDGYRNPTYATGLPGAVYDEHAPLVNASRKPTEWQAYDIIYNAPVCTERGAVIKEGSVTILLNGVLVQNHARIRPQRPGCEKGPLLIQDHSGFKDAPETTMRFRNIWYRPLDSRP
jgi:type 1 glutamine amidotransferase